MILNDLEEAYLAGTIPDIQKVSEQPSKLGSLWQSAKSTVGGWLSFGSEQEQSVGIDLDFWGNQYDAETPQDKKATSQNRMATKAINDRSKQSGDACSWYHQLNPFSQCNVITKSVTEKVSSVGDWASSTLTKAIVLIVIVAVIGLFLMSYVQSKAGRLANA